VWMQDEVSMPDNSSGALNDSLISDTQSVSDSTKYLYATLLDGGALFDGGALLPQLQYFGATLKFSQIAAAGVTSVGEAAGVYVNSTDGSVIEISRSGNFTWANELRTCSVNGQLSLPDESSPVFEVSVSIDGCDRQTTAFAGEPLSGVAAIQRSDSETTLYLIVRRPGQLIPLIDSNYLKR